jgi:AcrR family transcriptional regulator
VTRTSTLDDGRIPRQTAAGRAGRFPKLKPSPKGHSKEQVGRDQRLRLCAAMIELSAEHGYAAVTVRQLSSLAGVSTRDFYERFGGKEQCFLQAYEAIARNAQRCVAEAYETTSDPQAALACALRTLLSEIARRPKAARVALVESFDAGPAALICVRDVERRFAAQLELALQQVDPDAAPPPAPLVRAIVAGIVFVVRTRLLEGRAGELPALADELLAWMLCYRGTDVGELFTQAPCVPLLPADAGAGMSMRRAERGDRAGNPGGGCAGTDERARMMAAAARLAAGEGCAAVKPQAILAKAGLSRCSFKAHFQSVEDCVLAALETMMAQALKDAARAAEGRNWPLNVPRMIDALSSRLVADPVLAQLAFVETVTSGTAGISRCMAMMAAATRALSGEASSEMPPGGRLIREAAVGAAWCLAHECVLIGELSRLTELRDGFVFLILAPAMGAKEAAAAVGTDHGCRKDR